jgi:hypothetical protein
MCCYVASWIATRITEEKWKQHVPLTRLLVPISVSATLGDLRSHLIDLHMLLNLCKSYVANGGTV